MYKVSSYIFRKKADSGDTILYNAKTGAVITVDKENMQLVNDIFLSPNDFTEHENFALLVQNGFLIDNSFDEYEDIKYKYEKNFFSEDMINIVILPAEMCNFTCPYCFIYNYKIKIMSEDVYENIKKYIGKWIESSGKEGKKKYLKIAWFGGEPLLQKERIYSFMDEIHARFDDSCHIISSIITNGYDLSFEVFRKLLQKGITSYQVTFDGAKEDHNRLRKLKTGEGSYDTIIHHLNEIVQRVKKEDTFSFALRINFLKNTYKKIYGLIDDLVELIGEDQRFQIYCRPVYNFDTKRDDIEEIEQDILTIPEGLRIQNEFTRYIEEKRNPQKEYRMVNDYLPLPTTSWCAEDNMYSSIIGSDGSVYVCDSLVGDEKVCIGQLKGDGTIQYNNNSKQWRKSVFEYDNFKECKKCKRLPICVGSCKRERIEGAAKPCLWQDEDILKLMENYYLAHCSN